MSSFSRRLENSRAPVLALLVLITCGSFHRTTAQQSQTLSQGVYTDEQATRGATLYKAQCSSCHGDTLGGRAGPALTGNDFVANWQAQPLSELAGKIRNTMPQGNPGKLDPQQTADIVSYILQVGKFPAGRMPLSADAAVQKQIVWPPGSVVRAATPGPSAVSFPPAGNMAQVMRGILFPSSNIIFTAQSVDPGAPKKASDATADGGFNFAIWGGGIYTGWEMVDYAAIALAESAPLMLTPGRRCENGRPVPINDPEWIKFTQELADAGKAAYKASQTRNQEAVSESTNQLNDSCANCHQVYRDKRRGAANPLDPANKAERCVK
jgi:mono/diheme cytochrome c family protein